ncbi:MAG: methyltransferase [Desulfobacterales bacterium]|jgi:SAM-dependent methyltransferase
MKKSTKSRLTEKQIAAFPNNTLFDKIARAVCRAGTLPGKELFEAWEVARRIRRKYRGGRVVDLACGHGLLAHIMLLLDDSSEAALAVDLDFTENTKRLSQIIVDRWPRLENRIYYLNARVEDIDLNPNDIVVSVHACGQLTDTIIEAAVSAGAKLAVLPCCHDTKIGDLGGLGGWVDGPLAIDVTRAAQLRAKGYAVISRTIPEEITPKNRLLMAHPKFRTTDVS